MEPGAYAEFLVAYSNCEQKNVTKPTNSVATFCDPLGLHSRNRNPIVNFVFCYFYEDEDPVGL